ncbi:TetR/AcrR family transcriptional regulator [Arthrobacter sp. SO3]|uniref:TetR/AcrR family transcriptional regulator n=1 Tax=Arthrobacter sp. SO3 TaxID=1897057 RepID=UPI001D00174E|nr:TetR/AcrR family transcriptional regulator [Arthrobacter sp. SO3]
MAPPPALPRQRLRYTRILDVAAGFARKGLDSVVLSEVAAKADVPLGTLYRYFPSATQLVLALYRKQLTELHAANDPAAPGANAAAGVLPTGPPAGVAPGAPAGTPGRPAKKSAGRAAGRSATPPAANIKDNIPAQAVAGVVMEIFHMRLMQPAVEQSLNKAVYTKDTDTTKLLREIDSAAEKAVTAVTGDAAISRVLLLTVTGLVQSVRCRRLSLFEAEEDLKKACFLLTCSRRAA